MSEGISRWLLQLSEFDITVVAHIGLRSQPFRPREVSLYMQTCHAWIFILQEMRLAFDDSSTHRGGKTGAMSYAPDGTIFLYPSSSCFLVPITKLSKRLSL